MLDSESVDIQSKKWFKFSAMLNIGVVPFLLFTYLSTVSVRMESSISTPAMRMSTATSCL